MGCSNIVMGYPATQPLYILMAPLRVGHMGFAPCLDTPLRRCSAAAAMASPRCGTSPVLCRGINGVVPLRRSYVLRTADNIYILLLRCTIYNIRIYTHPPLKLRAGA